MTHALHRWDRQECDPSPRNGRLKRVANLGVIIQPDGTRVAYTVSETKMEKDKEWKNVAQVWVVAVTGGKSRQYTRGDKSATAPEWSPDGSMIAFLADRERMASARFG